MFQKLPWAGIFEGINSLMQITYVMDSYTGTNQERKDT